jgi:hypothetical protein
MQLRAIGGLAVVLIMASYYVICPCLSQLSLNVLLWTTKTKQVGCSFSFLIFFSCIYIEILAKFNKNFSKISRIFTTKKISTKKLRKFW